MNAKELRLGNYVIIENDLLPETKNQIYRVSGINYRYEYLFPDSTATISLDHLNSIRTYNQFDEFVRPILLTEEWLLKFGGIKDEDGWIYIQVDDMYDTRFYLVDDYIQLTKSSHCPLSNYHHVKTVHQLQNLFFAITGRELTEVQS